MLELYFCLLSLPSGAFASFSATFLVRLRGLQKVFTTKHTTTSNLTDRLLSPPFAAGLVLVHLPGAVCYQRRNASVLLLGWLYFLQFIFVNLELNNDGKILSHP